jgi:hypothetical protein
MTLPTVPPLTLIEIQNEFGAPLGTPLSAFLRGGAWVPDIAQNSGVPTTLPIAILDLLGATDQLVFPDLGLQWQCDVNTRGRSDGAPFEWISGVVGTNLSLGSAPIPGIGAPGDGGFTPMDYDRSLGGGDEQTTSNPDPAAGYGFFERPYTVAMRMIFVDDVGGFTGMFGQTGNGTGINGEVRSGGDVRYELFGPSGTGRCNSAGANLFDGNEHVLIYTSSQDGATAGIRELFIENVFEDDSTLFVGTPLAFTRADWAREYAAANPATWTGSIFWMAAWDFVISAADRALLGASPNPFTTVP